MGWCKDRNYLMRDVGKVERKYKLMLHDGYDWLLVPSQGRNGLQ